MTESYRVRRQTRHHVFFGLNCLFGNYGYAKASHTQYTALYWCPLANVVLLMCGEWIISKSIHMYCTSDARNLPRATICTIFDL